MHHKSLVDIGVRPIVVGANHVELLQIRNSIQLQPAVQQQQQLQVEGGPTKRPVLRANSYRFGVIDRLMQLNKKHPLMSPLQRFQHAVRIVILVVKCMSGNDQKQRRATRVAGQQDKNLLKAHLPTYGEDRLTFDVSSYRAQREFLVDGTVRRLLSMEPSVRTVEHVDLLIGVMNRQMRTSFKEFPVHMQRSLLKVATYAYYEADRVIIRQGHYAENFYMILSGKVIVTKMRPELGIGETFVTVLGKGSSFGDLALMYGSKRTATLTCHTPVELLAVSRDDYINIFMHADCPGQEPDFISFLRGIDVLRGWPLDVLPYNKPTICIAAYFRRDEVICQDMSKSDWLYFIKSGTCWVWRQLNHVTTHQQQSSHDSSFSSLPELNPRGLVVIHESHELASSSPDLPRSRSTATDYTAERQTKSLTSGRTSSQTADPTRRDRSCCLDGQLDETSEKPVYVRIRKLSQGDSFVSVFD